MSANSFGHYFRFHTFGESHGPALGVVIDGMPAGLEVDEKILSHFLERRRPGQSNLVSARAETDLPEILSGVFEGKTLGTPIAVIVRNHDARSEDYRAIAQTPRPGHADDVWKNKFGHNDPRGGGRSSGRETLCRVVAGAFAQMLVKKLYPQTKVLSWAEQIGPYELNVEERAHAPQLGQNKIDSFAARFPSPTQHERVRELLTRAKEEGKSYGGLAKIHVSQPPVGLGQPVFHKLKADFAAGFMSLGATASFELGAGRGATQAEGSEFHRQGEAPYGGIRGGISTGESLEMLVGFKPTSSVLDVAKKGRHDPCIVPRALPVLEAMTWNILADQILAQRLDRI